MKRKKYLSGILIAFGIALAGCGKQTTVAEKTANMQDKDTDPEENFNQVVVEGKEFALPLSCQDLENTGLDVRINEGTIALKNDFGYGYLPYEEDDNEMCLVEFRYSGDEESRPLEECDATAFTWDRATAPDMDVTVYGGITKDSSAEEISALLDAVYENKDTGVAIYGKNISDNAGITVNMDNGVVTGINVFNREGYLETP